ncbi:MAG TPA: response regulator transcription factor [Anaerolineae bacterium]|nr:response regulator transcription factor [Anaerolineae bacterium]
MTANILIVDDEDAILRSVSAYLEQEGYTVRTAINGRAALKEAATFHPDLIVLDIMLPELDGLEVLRQLRQTSDVYVIMLTAKADEIDKIVGLSLGADDYMTKPFSPRELVARIKAALRRISGVQAKSELVFSRLRIDTAARLAWKDGQPLDLTPIEWSLLHSLMKNHRRALSREQLVEQVWGYDYYGDERVVDVHIGRLRKKIEDDPTDPIFIATVWGAGYRFEDTSL